MEIAATKLSDSGRKVRARPSQGVRKPTARSGVSNGRDLLPNVDGRSLIARRYYDIQTAMVVDQGGVEQISEARLQLIRRFSAAACLAEQLESRLANGEEVDIAEHALLCSTMVRVARQIGVDRVSRDVTPSLDDLLHEDALRQQRDDAMDDRAERPGDG